MRKCPYCDFNSHEQRGDLPQREYIAALIADLDAALPSVWGRPIETVFFGGGTPSLLAPESLDALLSALRARLQLRPDAEITLEANPGTFEAEKFAQFRALGINRLSIGIQSFNREHLAALGRIHDARQALQAVEIARRSFDNFNLDLMYALPKQSLEQALADFDTAIELAPPHLSAYQLTLEPNTLFFKRPPALPDADSAAEIEERIHARLAEGGYEHYETSAFARAGKQCQHNLNYWRFGDYLGIGAGAHSKISFRDRIVRQMRHKHPASYMREAQRGAALQEQREVAPEDLGFEFMMNALRLHDGVPARLFEERCGVPINLFSAALTRAEASGLLERDHLHIRPSERGRRYLNDLLQLFLPQPRGLTRAGAPA